MEPLLEATAIKRGKHWCVALTLIDIRMGRKPLSTFWLTEKAYQDFRRVKITHSTIEGETKQ